MWRAEPLCILGGALLLIFSIYAADQSAGRALVVYEDLYASTSPALSNTTAWIDASSLAVTASDIPSSPAGAASSTETVSQKPEAAPAASVAAPPPPAITAEDLDNSSIGLRAALVNILCFAPAGSGIRSTSATGVIVSPFGYVLTNAHVALNFVLADEGVSCVLRTGDPAKNAYYASLVHIPAEWVEENAALLVQESPSGTGELDFALLAIMGSATSAPLPASFDHVPIAHGVPAEGAPVVIGSYGAQFLQFAQIQHALSPTVVFGTVRKLLTFGGSTADVLSLGGSAAAQEGSSGGGVTDGRSELVGTITTSTIEGETASRVLSAVTAAYMRREYLAETGRTLDSLLATEPARAVKEFASNIPALAKIVLDAIER